VGMLEACRKPLLSFLSTSTNRFRYWDWQLDWQDVTQAPIWDDEHGFGTTGVADQPERAILNGYCVMDGPFKDFVIPYLDDRVYPHCLSRGFAQGEELRNQSEMVSPDVIENLLSLNSYDAFNLGLEHGPHLAIPRAIRGDFSLLTAPSGKLIRIVAICTANSVFLNRSCILPSSRAAGPLVVEMADAAYGKKVGLRRRSSSSLERASLAERCLADGWSSSGYCCGTDYRYT
jgi:hypothetical protein